MTSALVVLASIAWIALGALDYSYCLAYFQRQYPTLARAQAKSDIRFALTAVLFGPIGLMASWSLDQMKHGRMWRLHPEEWR